ncbi:hypothetical protein EW146_g3108 [Bondarzewia mesenterica]|uniref:Uncharacterized protein n=1 Tax=Bondarzewia mesenterica TaxID=1095465 RepID=A0A4S4LYK7_9AGAM|nr:hypothetical protein EW146_g3108 [Bondarzewia mesenterica]
MQRFFVLLFSLFALLLCALPAHGVALTNAERLRKRMPPLPPVRRAPTPAGARRGVPSPSPSPSPVKFSGTIQVRSNGSTVGSIKKDSPTGVNFGSPDNDLTVKFVNGALQATNANFFVGGSGSKPIGPGSPNSVAFAAVQQGPTASIWSLDSSTGNLTAQWTNPDGSKPPTTIAFDIRDNILLFTGDLSAFNAQAASPASEVELFLVK